MGTNYYIRPEGACATRCDRWVHLGLSSSGWAFQFQAYPERPEWDRDATVTWPVTDYASWLKLLKLGEIYDEYGTPITADELVALIVRKRGGRRDLSHGNDADGNTFITGYFS
jgi:hypothetical protein